MLKCFVKLGLFGSLFLCLTHCARQTSSLTGGPRDTIPPEFLYAEPAMGATQFDAERIDLFFNEFVTLQNVSSTFIMSPPMAEQPDIVLYGKYIRVKLPEKPQPGYTYTLSFGETIADNNEGNKMGFFEYVFSTADQVDSLSLTGRVVNSFSAAPLTDKDGGSNIKILLYNKFQDSIPYLERPAYVGRTDQWGFFEINHLRADTFLVFALQDVGDDLMFKVPEERIAFLDTLVLVDSTFMQTASDAELLHTDSLKEKYASQVPHMLDLYMFQEEKTRQYRTAYARPQANVLMFTYNLPLDSMPSLALLDTLEGVDPGQAHFMPVLSSGRDTLRCWLLDTLLVKQPMLRVAFTGPVTVDSLRMVVSRTDTLRMQAEAEAAPAQTGRTRRRKENQQRQLQPYEKLELSANAGSGALDLYARLLVKLSQPAASFDTGRMQLLEMVNDSVQQPVDFRVYPDTADVLRYVVDAQLKEQKLYQFIADTLAFTSIYGASNDSTAFRIQMQALDYYSNIQIALHHVQDKVLVQVYPSGREEYVKQIAVEKSGVLNIAYLAPGSYRLKVVHDANGNGRWDTGNYLRHIQPERVEFYEEDVKTQSSFTTELDWTLK